MRTLLILMTLVTFTSPALGDVTGTYVGSGTNPGGAGTYDCDVVVTKTGSVYNVQWYFGGALGYDGVGILKDGLFCVGFASPEGNGVLVYDVNADGSLVGTWTMAGAEGFGTEKLKKQ